MQRGDTVTLTLTPAKAQALGCQETITGTIILCTAKDVRLKWGDGSMAWFNLDGDVVAVANAAGQIEHASQPSKVATPAAGFAESTVFTPSIVAYLETPCARARLTLSPFIAGKKGCAEVIDCSVMKVTDKALAVCLLGQAETLWMPISQIKAVKPLGEEKFRTPEDLGADEDLPSIPGLLTTPWAHQLRAYHFVKEMPGAMLAIGLGGGKSLVTVALLANDLQPGDVSFIFCPPSVIPVWPKQFRDHAARNIQVLKPEGRLKKNWCSFPKDHQGAIRILPLKKGMPTKRKVRLCQEALTVARNEGAALIIVTNYEAMRTDTFAGWAETQTPKWAVCDEIHKIKSAQGDTSKALAKLGKVAVRRLGLTGTPMPHSPLDIFGQYRFLAPEIFGEFFTAFRSYYAKVVDVGGVPLVKGYRHEDELNERFRRIAYQVGREVLDLPEATHIMRFCSLTPDGRKAYEELEDDFYTWLEEAESEVTVSNALTRLLRLQQVTSGFVKTDFDVEVPVDPAKEELLDEVLDDLAVSEPVIVFTRFTRDLDTIARVCAAQGRTYCELSGRADQLADWQAGKYDVIGVNIKAGEAGIDLTRAHYCIYYSLGFSLGDYDQSLARCHRPGQLHPVTYIHLLVENTVDEKVYKSLQQRRDVVEAILEWHKRHLDVHALDDDDPFWNQ